MELLQLEQDIYAVDDFLNRDECRQLIELAQQEGFVEADVQLHQERKMLKNIRNNQRADYHSTPWAEKLWQRLQMFELPPYQHLLAIGLSPYFRFYKYTPGQKFNMHKDGSQQVGEHFTRFTLLMYLNEGCEGGETQFRLGNVTVKPRTGRAVLFEHELWHTGAEVINGVKYALRTDVVYAE